MEVIKQYGSDYLQKLNKICPWHIRTFPSNYYQRLFVSCLARICNISHTDSQTATKTTSLDNCSTDPLPRPISIQTKFNENTLHTNGMPKSTGTMVTFHLLTLTCEKSVNKNWWPKPSESLWAASTSASITDSMSDAVSVAAVVQLRKNNACCIPLLKKSPYITLCTSSRCHNTWICTVHISAIA